MLIGVSEFDITTIAQGGPKRSNLVVFFDEWLTMTLDLSLIFERELDARILNTWKSSGRDRDYISFL